MKTEMELRNYLRIFNRWAWLMILLTILAAAGACIDSLYQPPFYRSSTRILIMHAGDNQLSNPLFNNDQQASTTFTELITSGPILQATSERIGYPVRSGQVFVSPVPQTDIIEITVEDFVKEYTDDTLRRPRTYQVLGISNLSGLSDVLRKQASIQEVGHAWGNRNLIVITSASLHPNPAEVLSSAKMTEVMEELKNQANIVISDSPPFLLADASVLAARSDGVLIGVQSIKTHLNAALSMKEQLNRGGARVVGVALNRMNEKDSFYYYGDLKQYKSYAYYIKKTQPSKKGT